LFLYTSCCIQWSIVSLSVGSIPLHISDDDGAYLRDHTDIMLLSSGGVGSTQFTRFLLTCRGSDGKMITTNQQGRHKHDGPQVFRNAQNIDRFLYLAGHLSHALRSLIRRHYTYIHTEVLGGDLAWIYSQKISFDSSVRLFHRDRGTEINIDKSREMHRATSLGVERYYRILTYISDRGVDPIGIVAHIRAWVAAAKASELPGPIMFVSLSSLQPSFPLSNILRARFRSFVRLPSNHTLMTYQPKYYKHNRLYRATEELQETLQRSNISRTEQEKILEGHRKMIELDNEINSLVGTIILTSGKVTPLG